MIDHAYRCIFIHQRKAAGTSVMSAFGKNVTMADWHSYNAGTLGKHWANRPHPESEYFVFSAIRNPFDRFVSAWKYLPSLRNIALEDVLRNLPQEGHDYRHITRPQFAILRDQKTGELVLDDLIRFESLQEDFDRICDRLGKPRAVLEKLNAGSRGKDFRDYYTRDTQEIVAKIFSEDLSTFGYRFE